MLLSTTGFALLLFGFSSAGSKGWSDPIVWSTTLIELTNVSIFFRIQIRSKSKKEQELEKHLRRDELKNKKAEIAPYSVISAFYLCL